jgi:CheY-like chemotaxis protein
MIAEQWPSPAPKRVLIVDDQVFIARAVGCILAEARGAAVEVATCGEDALPVAARWRPDLVLVDVRMPGLPSAELCRRLRAMPELAHTAVYLFTGLLPDDAALVEFADLQCPVITKPPDPRELLAALDATPGLELI